MKRIKQLACLAVVLGAIAPSPAAFADRYTRLDDVASSDRPTDIASVTHAHGEADNILRHEVVFDGQPESPEEVSLFFEFRKRDGRAVRRELEIRANPDGGLYGAFFTRRHRLTGHARAWMEDASTLVVEFSVPVLGRPRGEKYRWYVWSYLGAGEFDDPCAREDVGPPVCKDRAPAQGAIIHRY